MQNMKEIINKDSFTITCNGLYSMLRLKNEKLLKLSNKTNDVSFLDAIDFSITSNGISIIKSHFYGTLESYTTILLLRNVIEDFALKEMFLKGDIRNESFELLKYNGFIEDYKLYKKLDGVEYKKIIDYKKLEEDYQGSLSVYSKYGIKEKDVKKMDIPFLLNKKASHIDNIEKYLPEFLESYKLLSFYVHPHNYGSEKSDENIKKIFIYIRNQLINYYGSDLGELKEQNTFEFEQKFLLSFMYDLPDNYAYKFLNYTIEESNLLLQLSEKIEKTFGKNNYLNSLLKLLSNIVYDISTDSIHGQSENCKMKFKVIIELFAVYDWLYFEHGLDDNHFYLLNYYSLIKEYEVYGEDVEKAYKEAFEKFNKIYPNSNDYDKFKKVFGKTFGFTIDGDYCKKSINEIIDRYISRNFDKTQGIEGTKMSVVMHLLYSEACSLSRGKAYSFFSNSGAFMEDMNVIVLTDEMIKVFLNTYNAVLKTLFDGKKCKYIENKIDNFINDFEVLF